jgi:hypothetical protein
MVSLSLLRAAAVGLLAVWALLGVWIVAGRALYDRRRAAVERDTGLFVSGSLAVERVSSRRLQRLAEGDLGPAAREAARELVRRDSGLLLRLAGRRGFRRTPALRVLARGESPLAFACLREARAGGRPAVIAAVVAIAAELDTPAADELLVDVLVAGDHPRSRTATALEGREARLADVLGRLAGDPDPVLRYWALMLLSGAPPSPALVAIAIQRGTDLDARVRAAAARLIGVFGSQEALLVLRGLLADNVFFVRAHAARAAAKLGARSVAREVAALLADENWWVRAAAKESLLALGDAGLDAAVEMLHDPDRFARDGAAEIVLASGHLLSDPRVAADAASLAERLAG